MVMLNDPTPILFRYRVWQHKMVMFAALIVGARPEVF
jgi:hypothetical protein